MLTFNYMSNAHVCGKNVSNAHEKRTQINRMTINSSKPSRMRRQPSQKRSQKRVNQILDVAEQMFITEGYNAATTNAIATGAGVSIGSLYQFFPDKAAILQALAMRYTQQLARQLEELNLQVVKHDLTTYVDRMIDCVDQFFINHPGYHAIFMQMQGTMAELEEIENAADAQLIQSVAASLSQYWDLEPEDYGAIAFVLVKGIGNLLWLSQNQDPSFRPRLITETKRLMLSYLQSYRGVTESGVQSQK